jgi:hypothetical protein
MCHHVHVKRVDVEMIRRLHLKGVDIQMILTTILNS